MNQIGIRTTFLAAIVAGLAAALVVTGFHSVFTESIIEQSIALEETLHTGMEKEKGPEVEVVSREVQRTTGLVTGFLIYGMSWALLFGVVFVLAQNVLPGSTAVQRGLLLAVLAYLAVALVPFLKYPANPPGVGEPDSIGFRQNLYIAMLVLSIVGAAAAVVIGRLVAGTRPAWMGVAAGGAVLLVLAVLWSVMLPANPDPIRLPDELITGFRVRSLMGLTLFWSVLGAGFVVIAGWLARRTEESVAARVGG